MKSTSQSSFFDCDNIPKFGEKPEGWKATGKRVSRGVYETSDGFKINPDCNGAANILKKVAVMLGIDLSGISRGCLSQPQKVSSRLLIVMRF
ncbi:transposase [Cylindrospermopsis raciborskii C04]|uniref:Transposase n=1 Tax=Cylindrospermopsis raciborskii C07 TaxID=2014886 RepID=A0ABX4WIV7_9CYAN|nr:transposase [Cylindrospermopsis raciborskii C03]PNJ92685.1 transposase [Cylindrospermopsis raciborskii C07]PNJ92845.1 transposase [Cylindrospermopsis raciborskii C04]